ncbi:alpha/beta hydrolase [Wenzhouxiangella sp. XN201]|uniref:alpha/beta fold hydrolase n=1 Tax=Wenzhouxiangella sp. XN201 TaxID=2710755 RepID=UPI0013CDD0FD|nr:alpha/beta hydrolase [Wenzhouxiangella sp. XN201]NEZ04994.1 alpha/beta hydrolase [Wenzhouxiangella sp. XN201]
MSDSRSKAVRKRALGVFQLFAGLVLLAGAAQAGSDWPRVVYSEDGTPISYEVHGSGEPTLVFVHGWSCDLRYWRAQVRHFSRNHKVVTVDLAGHGHSGLQRESYSMSAFGEDVRAVIEAVGSDDVVLIGHSMGGPVVAETAQLLPDRVRGLIGVDTFQNLEEEVTQEGMDEWLAPFKSDFRERASQFVASMFVPETDESLRDWVIADMSAAPPDVAMSAMEHLLKDTMTGEARQVFDGLEIPVVTINADLWPTNVEANRRHMHSFDAVLMQGTDHFLHMARPEAFNTQLAEVIAQLTNSDSPRND